MVEVWGCAPACPPDPQALTTSPQAPGSPEDPQSPLLISLPNLPQGGKR